MRDALTDVAYIQARLHKRSVVLALDFDGTLSPLVPHHADARIAPAAREALGRLARCVPVMIVSGRAVSDVRRRVGIRGVAYVGCHGLELFAHGKHTYLVSPRVRRAFAVQVRALEAIAASYPGLLVEKKPLSIAFHYRALSTSRRRALREDVARIVATGSVACRILDDKHALDIMPIGADKGRVVARLLKTLAPGESPILVFIGDGLTDEDVFRRFSKHIMIRVGKRAGSAARYYLREREDVDTFLRALNMAL